MPLGSASEKTKHENASRNSSPHGPCAMPPKHGQSQLISPVSGLNAPPWPPLPSPSSPSPSPAGVGAASPSGAGVSAGAGLPDFGIEGSRCARRIAGVHMDDVSTSLLLSHREASRLTVRSFLALTTSTS
ncbi:hypothetical protein NUW54_g11931 [Trametes sanguinea]|uniref:Uncharacterized protein n=1 Tax=Trametes sanguinea TaxID=158606 RepID=A0ACC1N6X4_9APHY|nr:hypothetical protein NUW54_g11931 [Trametes sanguinea]